jgi:hypothetical protein
VLDIHAYLAGLAGRRPIFHSEADFQHALAWQIQLGEPMARIRLETRPERGVRLDLLVMLAGRRIAIELKYFVTRLTATVFDEKFDPPSQGAQDLSRYDFIKDIGRIETCLRNGYADEGWVIALSNDPSYWAPGRKMDSVDASFKLHEGRSLTGLLAWASHTGGTMRSREAVLELSGTYVCTWRPYSEIEPGTRAGSFKYLALQVRNEPSL